MSANKSLILAIATFALMASSAQAADVAAGKAKASEACADCHGDNGKGDPENPSIAGMAPDAFVKAMKEYQSGVRTKSKKMTKSANKLNETEVADLAAYYATLPK